MSNSQAKAFFDPTADIKRIIDDIEEVLPRKKPRTTIRCPDTIDPERFNRIEVFMGTDVNNDKRQYSISVFQSSTIAPPIEHAHAPVEPDAPEPKPFNSADHFSMSDFRATNPRLHRLYVANAREAIRLTRSFCEAMWERSRWPDSEIAQAAWAAIAEHAKTDAAWFEAAALEFLHQEEDVPFHFPRIDVDMGDLPPGEYTGHLEERDGILVFVVNPPETPVD